MKDNREAAVKGVKEILTYLGEDINRQGLQETPERFIKSLQEMTSGYNLNPDAILSKFFDEVEGYNELVLLQNIQFESMCEHHLSPIMGNAVVGYIPDKRVVGLSKLARIVDVFAKRLQIQERLTNQIGQALERVLMPKGVGVIIRARHNCLCGRGAYKTNAAMSTTFFSGLLKTDPIEINKFYMECNRSNGNGVHYTQ